VIAGLGTDIVEVGRIERGHQRHGRRFLDRLFTAAEIEYCERQGHPFQSYAARFAAKEAFLKALGRPRRDGIRWRDMEVVRTGTGAPELRLRGRALVAARQCGMVRPLLTLSHTARYATAVVVLEGSRPPRPG
jgi:holo-[acyl-carrier protein] synthase